MLGSMAKVQIWMLEVSVIHGRRYAASNNGIGSNCTYVMIKFLPKEYHRVMLMAFLRFAGLTSERPQPFMTCRPRIS